MLTWCKRDQSFVAIAKKSNGFEFLHNFSRESSFFLSTFPYMELFTFDIIQKTCLTKTYIKMHLLWVCKFNCRRLKNFKTKVSWWFLAKQEIAFMTSRRNTNIPFFWYDFCLNNRYFLNDRGTWNIYVVYVFSKTILCPFEI